MGIWRKIYGYLIIPVWILCFFGTTLFLIYQAIVSWFGSKILKKSNKPYFAPRSIFPPVNKEKDHG